MLRVQRVDDLVIFTDEASDVGFHCNLSMFEITRLRFNPEIDLSEENAKQLFDLLLEFRIVYIDEGELFRQKPPRFTVKKPIVIKMDSSEEHIEAMVDAAVEKIDELVKVSV